MQKADALAALGQRSLLLPGWVTAALAANDRLKGYLTLLQAAAAHAARPQESVPSLTGTLSAAGLQAPWLLDLAASARSLDDRLTMPDLPRLLGCLRDDLATLARPLAQTAVANPDLAARITRWLAWLASRPAAGLSAADLAAMTRGRRDGPDSLHLLIMELHRQLNQLSGELATEMIDGASTWNLQPEDHAPVAAFMHGLHRTAGLKFDHPGLATAATRDGDHLLLQNDIGTNDAHVLVLRLTGHTITLTYSDLHRTRLQFFQTLLVPFGAVWSDVTAQTTTGLNEGDAYALATARFDCPDDAALAVTLAGIGAQIVFLIDWNQARKRLQDFVRKADAIAILAESTRLEAGHRAWLQVGGAAMVFTAMQAAGEGTFRIGDRLGDVIGAPAARAFLLQVLQCASHALRNGQPAALVADETRLALVRCVHQGADAFALLAEHAGYCHALAQAVSDALAHGSERIPSAAQALAARAKTWEQLADHLVTQAREKAARHAGWVAMATLAEQSDEIADALEEAAFLVSLIADHHLTGWTDGVRAALQQQADTVLAAAQEHVKAIAIAGTLAAGSAADDSAADDSDAFLGATWRVVDAERQGDVLLRTARRVILATLHEPSALLLANDLAATLEAASDSLLKAAYGLRALAFARAGVHG